jgi:hypothetical protein
LEISLGSFVLERKLVIFCTFVQFNVQIIYTYESN